MSTIANMHRPRGRSVSQMQDTEIPNIEGHHEYVNKVLKWSISDLDRFIQLLRARVSAEEAYIASLAKISKTQAAMENEPFNCFGDTETTFRKATLQYELSINQLITIRQNLVRSMNAKIKMLSQVKEAQENRRKVVKMRLNERNSRYISYRTRDIVKLQRTYWHKCTELQVVQQQLHQQQAHQQQQASNDSESREGDAGGRLSVEEPRPRLSSDSGRDSDSISSLNNDTTLKKGMANLMAQMRTQLANATAAAAVQDMMKQNAKCARISNEIITADMEYRDGIRTLEKYRREQIEEADLALEQIEVVFRDKTNATQTALREVLISERTALAEENRLLDHSAGMVEMMDGKRDISLFNNEYRKRGFIKPSRIYYKNFYHGECKDLLFGTSLEAYAAEHNRTVPLVVSKCIEAVERMGGLQKEGIYRISGRQSNVDILKYAFEQNEQGIDLEKLKFDVVTIASVLKIYLRELKEPLFSLSVNSRMEYATLDKQRRLGALANKLSSIPKSHRDTLYVLVRHLAQVNEHSEVNKMNMQNLSVVFTPAIFHDHNNAEVPGEWRCDSVFEDLITHHKTLFISAENKPKQSTSRPPPGPTPITIPSSTSLNTSGGMLLTAPLHPSSLGASPEPSASSGYENTYPTSWKDGTPRPPPPNASALHRSVSLTPNRRNIQPSPFQPPPLQPSPLRTASSKHQLEIDTSNKQQPPQIPPLPELTSQQQTPSSAPSNTTTDENQASVASTLIGMAALSGAIDDTMIGGGLRGLNQHTEQSPVTSPTDEFQSKRTSKGVIPPRQDSLRQQLAHQQMMGGPPPPIITTTPIPKPSRPSPSGPQTPTLSTTADHVPFSAQIITTNDDNGNSSNKQTEEKQQLPSTAELSSTQS